MPATAHDRGVADDLAAAVARANGRTWRKVTTILDLFGVHRLTPAVRGRIAEALDEAGLEVRPPLQEAKRYESLRLSLPAAAPAPADEPAQEVSAPGSGILHVTEWRRGEQPRSIALAHVADAQGAVWILVDPARAVPGDLLAALQQALPDEITKEMVDDLLNAEPFPKIAHLDDAGRLRSVSAFRALAEEGPEARAGAAGRLVFEIHEFISGEGWIVSGAHRSRVYEGAHEADRAPEPPDRMLEAVEERWLRDDGRTAGDLGTFVLHYLACSYTDVRRTFHAWLETWELDFFQNVKEGERHFDMQTLIDLRGLIAQLAKRLRAMKIPRELERGSWFYGVKNDERAAEIDDMLTRGLDDLHRLTELVRSSFDLVQLELSKIQQRAAEGLQRRLEQITAILLVPTLIAGIFGANTWLPGGERWTGFVLMGVLIVVGAFVTWRYLRRHGPGEPQT